MTEAEALKIVMSHMAPGSTFVKSATYENSFIFLIHGPDPVEGTLDPFFSVDKTTGEFSDFDVSRGGPELVRQFN